MQKFKGFIFDFNGVLLLDQPLHDEVWKKINYEVRHVDATAAEVEEFFHGRTNELTFEYIFGRPLERDELDRWAKKKELMYQDLAKTIGANYRFAPGAIELFRTLRARTIPYTIATSSPSMNIPFYNEMLGLETWFALDKISFDDGTVRGKPAPDLYLRAAMLLQLQPEECVVVEDARSGIAAAYAAHIGHIIAIAPKSRQAEFLRLEGVKMTIEELAEIDIDALF